MDTGRGILVAACTVLACEPPWLGIPAETNEKRERINKYEY